LMQAGANPSGYPLIMAIQAGHPRVVEAMLSFGADPNTHYVDSSTGESTVPLIHAVSCRRLASVRLLLGAGADPNARGTSGMTPLSALASTRTTSQTEEREGDIRGLLVARGAR
jgi:ankyrin repeat protein